MNWIMPMPVDSSGMGRGSEVLATARSTAVQYSYVVPCRSGTRRTAHNENKAQQHTGAAQVGTTCTVCRSIVAQNSEQCAYNSVTYTGAVLTSRMMTSLSGIVAVMGPVAGAFPTPQRRRVRTSNPSCRSPTHFKRHATEPYPRTPP
jgi:hypothetical protein